MAIEPGDYAVALKSANSWYLKQICKTGNKDSGISVNTGSGWALALNSEMENENFFAVSVGEENLLVSLKCVEDSSSSEPCTGNDPLCSYCPCDANLKETYIVMMSGFPSICDVSVFNGAWTVTHVDDCVWYYEIDDWNWVELAAQQGVKWRVSWGVKESDGLSGYYSGYFGDECAPELQTYYYAYDFSYGCDGLSDILMNSVRVMVA